MAKALQPEVLRQPINQVKRARQLRKAMSLPEVLLWKELKKRPGEYKFRKQFPLSPLTIDFVCLSSRLAIEVDGETHDRGDSPRHDEARDRFVRAAGFRVLRIMARDVFQDMEACLRLIVEHCRSAGPPPPSLRDGPPPRAGEDFL
ncbi:MAG TPA: endonuclease domain-containing protein [Sphingomonadaceae bacterium]